MMYLPLTVVWRTKQLFSRQAIGWDNSGVHFSVLAAFGSTSKSSDNQIDSAIVTIEQPERLVILNR